eukprot:5605910-Prymnesium_polylepis.1
MALQRLRLAVGRAIRGEIPIANLKVRRSERERANLAVERLVLARDGLAVIVKLAAEQRPLRAARLIHDLAKVGHRRRLACRGARSDVCVCVRGSHGATGCCVCVTGLR